MVYYIIKQLLAKCGHKIPTRLNVAIMLFFNTMFGYMLRVNFSVNLLAMVKDPQLYSNVTENVTTIVTELPDYGPRYGWNMHDQGILMGAYYWGYFLNCLPGGMMAERFGGARVTGFCLLIIALLTAICPLAARLHYWLLWLARFLIGLITAPIFSAFHSIVSKWAPPDEKGRFIAALMGNTFGTVITFPLAGIIIETIGWVWAFYIPALLTGIFSILWFIVVADTPEKHSSISKEERDYIENSLSKSISKQKAFPPFAKIITSLPVWALILSLYGNIWGLYFVLTAAPRFMNEILEFKLSNAGFLSSLPNLMRLISGFLFGFFGDSVSKKQVSSVTVIRKTFTIFSHIIPGLFLLGMLFIDTNAYLCVTLMTLSLGFNGAATVTSLQNAQDLAPNFAGTVYGLANCISTTTGVISPLIVSALTKYDNTMEQWKYIFLIGAAVYIIPGIFFIIFGSGKVQQWNEIKKKENKEIESV